MKTIITYLFTIVTVLIVSCSNEIASGGSSSEVVAKGIIYTTDNSTINDVQVYLIPSSYSASPQTATLPLFAITDSSGFFKFDSVRKGQYNLYARHPSNPTRLLDIGINLDIPEDTVSLDNNTLKHCSSMLLSLPSTFDTANDYIYLEGTTLSFKVSRLIKMSDNTNAVQLDSLPSGKLPAIRYYSKSSNLSRTLATAVTTKENNTVVVGTTSGSKPIWNIPIIVGISDSTAKAFGGIDSMSSELTAFITNVNSVFNTPDAFNGIIKFYIDSVYAFTRPCSLERYTLFSTDFAVRILFDGYSNVTDGWIESYRTAIRTETVGSMFNQKSVQAVAWQLGLSRGCIFSSYMFVIAENNPVNKTSYDGEYCFMYRPYTATAWDKYNIYAVNYYNTRVNSYIPILPGYPYKMTISTRTGSNTIVKNAQISVFGVRWNSFAVTDTIVSSSTDTNGRYTFQTNPYKIVSNGNTVYCNLLLRAISSTDTAYTWMPINEPGISFFENGSAEFVKTITFSK
ncbi:MAG: hypothetical protein ACM31E_08400 [Fibrobacterota bacterium]|nr:hypothetical protein [Chitinispirillaceae bacterium]